MDLSKMVENSSTSCQHFIAMNKEDEKSALAWEEKFKQDASSFQILPAMETMDSAFPAAHNHLTEDKNSKDSESVVAPDSLLEKVSIVKCTPCDKSVALLVCESYQSLYKLLHDSTKPDGWTLVGTEEDRLTIFVLNQIIYREYEVPDEDELQVEYAFPPVSDFTKILWVKGKAIGFYTAKAKELPYYQSKVNSGESDVTPELDDFLSGSLDLESMDWYRMTVLDTLFIRNSERRRGYALSAIKDIIHEFPDQNIGFSTPISLPMIQVLKKYLVSHPADRMKLWEVDGCGLEGNCQILWFLFGRR